MHFAFADTVKFLKNVGLIKSTIERIYNQRFAPDTTPFIYHFPAC